MIDPLNKPIPGQSLTGTPGGHPYERPPEITDPEEAIQMHLTRLSQEDKLSDLLDILETGVDVKTLTTGILRSAVATGIHSIDVALGIAPVVHEYITTTADMAGIDYDEGLVDEEADEKKDKELFAAKAMKLAREQLEDEKSLEEKTDDPFKEEASEEVDVGVEEGPELARGFIERRKA